MRFWTWNAPAHWLRRCLLQVKVEVGLENGSSQSAPDPRSEATNFLAITGALSEEVIPGTSDCMHELLVIQVDGLWLDWQLLTTCLFLLHKVLDKLTWRMNDWDGVGEDCSRGVLVRKVIFRSSFWRRCVLHQQSVEAGTLLVSLCRLNFATLQVF